MENSNDFVDFKNGWLQDDCSSTLVFLFCLSMCQLIFDWGILIYSKHCDAKIASIGAKAVDVVLCYFFFRRRKGGP